MGKSVLVGVLVAVSLLGAPCRDSLAAEADDTKGLWIGSAHVTMSRSTSDFGLGYTMRSDFWFRVDADGKVKGKAYAVYQPTFDSSGMNAKIELVKSAVGGALSLLPGGGLTIVGTAAEASRAGSEVALSGLVGVQGKYNDPKPIRTGAITGTLRRGTLTLDWADVQPPGIPLTVSLQYINKSVPITNTTVRTQVPWHKPATIDPDSGGRFAIAQEQSSSSEDGVDESIFAHWNATRVE